MFYRSMSLDLKVVLQPSVGTVQNQTAIRVNVARFGVVCVIVWDLIWCERDAGHGDHAITESKTPAAGDAIFKPKVKLT